VDNPLYIFLHLSFNDAVSTTKFISVEREGKDD